MDVANLIKSVRNVIAGAKSMLPIIDSLDLPVVDNVVKIVRTATDIVDNVVERANEAKVVITSTDQQEIDNALEEIQAVNDELAAYIASH